MAESNHELYAAASSLLRWDKRRSVAIKYLRYDSSVVTQTEHGQPAAMAWAIGDFRVVPSSIVWIGVMNANHRFCSRAIETLGAQILPHDKTVAPDRIIGGHAQDPLVEFSSGLILRSVAAAEYVLETPAAQ